VFFTGGDGFVALPARKGGEKRLLKTLVKLAEQLQKLGMQNIHICVQFIS
jgi:hypothetical protein